MKINQPSIVLVRPQLSENIGLVARAMQNCGLNKLIIVSPRDKWPNAKAIKAAANANKIIENAKIYYSLNQSLSKFHYVIATSSRKRFLNKPHKTDFSSLFIDMPINKNIAILFGPERSGLKNDDLSLCDCLFSVPLSYQNQSLNLSHSVLIFIYKWQEYFDKLKIKKYNNNNLADKKNINLFMKFLKSELVTSGFLFPKEKSHSMFNNIQSIFLRSDLSKADIQTLWGMIKTLQKPRIR